MTLELTLFTHSRHQLELVDHLPDPELLLVHINHSSEGKPFSLTPRRLGEKVVIVSEKHTTERTGSIEKLRIVHLMGTILERRHDVDVA